jgi:hypothetical protein
MGAPAPPLWDQAEDYHEGLRPRDGPGPVVVASYFSAGLFNMVENRRGRGHQRGSASRNCCLRYAIASVRSRSSIHTRDSAIAGVPVRLLARWRLR